MANTFVEEATWANRPVPFASGLPDQLVGSPPPPQRLLPRNRHLGPRRTRRHEELEARRYPDK